MYFHVNLFFEQNNFTIIFVFKSNIISSFYAYFSSNLIILEPDDFAFFNIFSANLIRLRLHLEFLLTNTIILYFYVKFVLKPKQLQNHIRILEEHNFVFVSHIFTSNLVIWNNTFVFFEKICAFFFPTYFSSNLVTTFVS